MGSILGVAPQLLMHDQRELRAQNQHNARRRGPNLDLGCGKVMVWQELQQAWDRRRAKPARKTPVRLQRTRRAAGAAAESEIDSGRRENPELGFERYCHVFQM